MSHARAFLLIVMLLIIPGTVLLFGQSRDEEHFNQAVQAYRAEKNEDALGLFQSFLDENPGSLNVDDAYWYIGRIYTRLGNQDAAILYYRRVFEWPERSSKLSATLYDLAKLYYRERNYHDVTDLLDKYDPDEKPNRNDHRFLHLAGKSYYRLGYRSLNDYKTAEAADYFNKAIGILTEAADGATDTDEKLASLVALGETYFKALESGKNRAEYDRIYDGLEKTLAEIDGLEAAGPSPDVEELRRNYKALKMADFSAELETAGGLSTIALSPGFQVNLDLDLAVPLGFRQELEIKAGYDHDSFGLKTFNFLPEETDAGDIRLIQSTDDISGKISWNAGSRRSLYSRFSLSGGAGWADDPEDHYYTLKAAESLDFRVSKNVKTGIDADIRWKVFPNYLINNRKLDYILGTTSPYLELSPVPNFDIKTAYKLEIKQYLDAKYEASSGVPAEKNRRFIVNGGEVLVDGKFWSFFRPGLGYMFSYNKSNNYNVTVDGLPADVFVEGYYDFFQHDLSAKADFRWGRRLKTDIDGSVSFRNFVNYPVRDETKTFTGELRKDTDISVSARMEYIFWSEKKNGFADFGVYADAEYVASISNMTYENSFATNYEYAIFLLGVHIDLP